MNIDQKGIIEFQKYIEEWGKAYNWMVISYIALKKDGELRLLFCRIKLDIFKGEHTDENFSQETSNIYAGHIVRRITDESIQSIVEGIKKAEMKIGEKNIRMFFEDVPIINTNFNSYNSLPGTQNTRWPYFDEHGSYLDKIIGNEQDVKKIDWELKAHNIPFSNLDELLLFCGLPKLNKIYSSTIEIYMAPPILIGEDSQVNGGDVKIYVLMSKKLEKNKIKIGYRLLDKGVIIKGNINGSQFEWVADDGILKGKYILKCQNDGFVQSFLSYDNIAWYEWWIGDPSKQLVPRLAIHRAFDDNLEILKDMLLHNNSGAKSQIFEGAVSMLFIILGFTAENYGRYPKLMDGPDVIAGTYNGNICVIECTVELPGLKDKMAKVIQRTVKIREKLNPAFAHYKLLPTIVTRVPRKQVEAHLKEAQDLQIALICREDIEKYLEQIMVPKNPDDIFDEITKLIPGTHKGGMFGVK